MALFRKFYVYLFISSLLIIYFIPSKVITGRQARPAVQPYMTEPAVSPDRSEIAFVSGGDIWTVPMAGGEARLLVSHPATESRPLYSPDGGRLAFISNRTGNGDIYVLTFTTGDVKRMTFDDVNDQLDAWSRDGRWLYFSSTSRDISGMNDIFRVSSDGGTPMQVSADRYTNEFFAAPSPDGQTIAFTARGNASAQWWRKGHSHLDESEIWLMHDGAPQTYERVTEGGAKEMWPMWGAQANELFYVSDRSGAQNVWRQTVGGRAERVTTFRDGRVLWPNISLDGRVIVFEHDFRIWKLETNNGQAHEVSIALRGSPASASVEHVRLTDQIQELALSPDGKKVAFVVRGEIFAASSTDGGDAARVTNSPAYESQINWSPDSRRLAYVSDRDGTPHIFLYDFTMNTETQLTRADAEDVAPRFSPDGKWLAFQRGNTELRALEMSSRQERLLATAKFEMPPINPARPFVWSPDSRWIAFLPVAENLFSNIYVVSVEGGESRAVSFLANVGNNTLSWSPDGTFLLFVTGQRTENGQVARVDLIPRTPRFREDQFRELFREEQPRTLAPNQQRPESPQPATTPQQTPSPSPSPSPSASPEDQRKPAVKKVEIVFDEIRRRLSLLPVGIDVNYEAISPDGKYALMIASAAGQENLYVYSLDELSREPAVAKQLTSTPGNKNFAQFSPDSKEVFYLDQGRINVVSVDGKQTRPLAVSAEMDIDFSREKMEVFHQAWSLLNTHFYDPNFHGVNWSAMRDEYEPLIAGARNADEVRRLLQLMIGELNASHLGASPPPNPAGTTTGRLGLRFDRAEYESRGRLRVTEVIPLGPAALAREIIPGTYILAADGREVDAHTNLDEALNYKINRRVVLTIASSAEGANRHDVAVRPVSSATEKALLYRQWVEANRAYVARISNNRLGYVHMFDMSASALAQLYVDLDAENHEREGVVIDVRNNNGGFVNVYAIDVFERRGYLTMTPRGEASGQTRTVLGQRALERPTILVTNQHSLSDAEDFTEGYRSLHLGKVVGEPTAGWIIFTWNLSLIDGTVFRIPHVRITANDGTNMERNPRPVDVPVSRPVGETYTGRDSQLDAAVRELLGQLGRHAP